MCFEHKCHISFWISSSERVVLSQNLIGWRSESGLPITKPEQPRLRTQSGSFFHCARRSKKRRHIRTFDQLQNTVLQYTEKRVLSLEGRTQKTAAMLPWENCMGNFPFALGKTSIVWRHENQSLSAYIYICSGQGGR